MYRQLSTRIFLLLIVLLIGLFSGFTYINITAQSQNLMQTVIASADRTSELIRNSTRYSMLLNRKEDVYHIIRTLGNTPGFDGIRIYNKQGKTIFSSSEDEIDQRVNMDAEACTICHGDTTRTVYFPSASLATRIFTAPDGHRVVGLINPIRNEEDCSNAACHAHPASQTVLGVLDVKMSLAKVDEALEDARKKTITFFVITVIIVALVSGIFIRRMVHVPVKRLIEGTRALAAGDLDHQIEIDRNDEIGELARSFNTMTDDLRKARNEITDWSKTLEQKVTHKTEELRKAQHHLIQVEKMASLGKLSASVAHEINNPLAGILTYTKLIMKKFDMICPDENSGSNIKNYLGLIHSETARCGNIVKNLLLFARKGEADFAKQDIIGIVDKSLILINHHLEMQNIKLQKNLPDHPCEITCDGNQLQQAFIALFINAVESMDEAGGLMVALGDTDDGNSIYVSISDTGHGIREDLLPHIFEPFFTTKKEGKGVGLGLSIVYGIIRRHNGEIKVASTVGEGTTFTILLPKETQPSAVNEIFSNE